MSRGTRLGRTSQKVCASNPKDIRIYYFANIILEIYRYSNLFRFQIMKVSL
jgi:hypothetical protein